MEALDDDFDFENPDNQLDDDFFIIANDDKPPPPTMGGSAQVFKYA